MSAALGTWKRHQSSLLAMAFFGLLTFITLDNLILHLGTAIPDSHSPYRDDAIFYWSLWWFRYAVLHLHADPMFTNYILFPSTVNLSMHSHVFTLGLLSLPFQLFLDMHWIVNGWIVLSFFLSATCMFILLRRHVGNAWLAVLGATLYAFNASTTQRALYVHLNLLPLWWLPLSILLWDVTLERRSVRWATVLGACVYLAFMTYSEHLLWITLVLAPYMLYGVLSQTSTQARWRVLGLASAAFLAALLPALFVPLPQTWQLRLDEYAWQGADHVLGFAMPFTGLFTPKPDSANPLGLVLSILVLVGLALSGKRRERWLWLAIGLVNVILALGPYLGDPSHPLPFMLVYNLTRGQYRTPERLATPASLALVVFAAMSLTNWFDRLRSRWMQASLVMVFTVVHILDIGIVKPFPIFTAPDYSVYHVIGTDPEDHTLLQVPIGVAGSSRIIGPAAYLAYYARFHHQRTINGVVSRLPTEQLDRYEQTPFLLALALGNPLPPFEEARAEFLRRLKNWDIRYIVVHKDLLVGEEVRSFVGFFNEQPELCVFHDDADTIGYRAISSWADCPRPDMTSLPSDGRLDLGEPGDGRFVGTGWYDAENVGGPQARWAGEISTSTLRVVLPLQDTRVRFRALAYPPDQTVTISVNGGPVTTVKLGNDWGEHDFVVPRDLLHSQGPNVITLVHAHLESAFERTGGRTPDDRPLAAAYDYFVFEPAD